jgi:phage terminase large subunit GpA-like protein
MNLADAFLLTYTAAYKAIKPKARLTVSEWADTHRMLSEEGSAEPGQWKTSRNPPMREIMDALSEDAKGEKVVLMKPSQWGGTEIGSNFIGYIVDHAKGPAAVIMPTERSLNDWVSQKFDPMAKDTPAVNDAINKKSNRSSDNNAQRKKFLGGILYFKTAGSTAELKSTSLRYALADEVDEWEWSTNQGDPIRLLEIRLTAFHDSKLYLVSSPTMKDASHIEDEFDKGDQRRYHVPCNHCGELQVLKWQNLRWEKDLSNKNKVVRVYYACEHHGCVIEEFEKSKMLANGKWIAAAPHNRHRSYHINGLYTPIGLGKSWMQLVYEWIDAQDDPKDLMVFVNTRLAESFADRSHDIKPNVLKSRAEPYELRTIPIGCLIITAGVDVQDDRLEIQITGTGEGDKTWPVDYHVIPGNPAHDEVWHALTQYLLASKFTNAFGKSLRLEATAIDTGGHHTHKVYEFVRNAPRLGLIRVMACKGASTYGRTILGRPTLLDVNWKGQTIKKGVALYIIGADTAKHLLYNRLNGDVDKDASERKVHFSQHLEDSYFEGIVSETYNPRKNRWELKKGKRNEQLDTWILSLAASMHPEIYVHKWRKSDWERRRMMLEPVTEKTDQEGVIEKLAPELIKNLGRTRRRVVKR